MIIPRHLFEDYNGPNWREAPANLQAIGTGAYRVAEFIEEDILIIGEDVVSTIKIVYEITIRALMGVPLKSGVEVIGVLGIAYDIESDKRFGEDEVELLSRFAQLASISLDNARLYTAAQDATKRTEEANKRVTEQNRMLESISNQLSKFLSPQLYASIFSGEQSVEVASQRKKLTVFFSDIVDFAETTDSLESEELTSLLNH